MNKADLITEITNKILSGGNRTTAANVRTLLGEVLDSYPNIDDGGNVFNADIGYSSNRSLGSDYSFTHKKYVDSIISSVSLNYIPKQSGTSLINSAIYETVSAVNITAGKQFFLGQDATTGLQAATYQQVIALLGSYLSTSGGILNGNLQFNSGNIMDSGGIISIDPNNRRLYYSGGVYISLDYYTGQCYDGAVQSFNYKVRQMYDSVGADSIYWNTRMMYDGAGNPIVSWSSTTQGLVYQNDYSPHYTNRSLIDYGFGNTTYAPIVAGGYLPKSGGTSMTGVFNLSADATTALQPVTYQQAIAMSAGMFKLQQGYNASSNAYPTASNTNPVVSNILKGFVWNITVAGTLGGVPCQAGDVLTALVDNPGTTAANWLITEHDLGFTPISNVLTSAYVLVGNSSNVATGVALSGAVTISNSGVVTIANNYVTNAMLAGLIAYSKLVLTGAILNADLAGSIAYSKLVLTGSIVNADIANGTIDITTKVTGILPVTNGGTGLASTTAYGVICGGTTSTGAYQNTGAGNAGQVLTSNGAGAVPTFQTVPPSYTANLFNFYNYI